MDFACHPSGKSFYPTFFYLFLNAPQLYLFVILSSYGTAQRDHGQYDRLYDPSQPLTGENIPLDYPTDPWDSRPSVDHDRYHVRNSTISASEFMNNQKPENLRPSIDQFGGQDPRYHVRNDSTISTSEFNQRPVDNYQKPEDNFFNYNASYGYTNNANNLKRGAADNF